MYYCMYFSKCFLFYFNRYLYIKVAKSFFNVLRAKLSPRPRAAEARQSQGFRGQGDKDKIN
jgi:hypothetical protein